MSRGFLYQPLSNDFVLQPYLSKSVDTRLLQHVARIRLLAHNLNIERGRYYNVERNNRLYIM